MIEMVNSFILGFTQIFTGTTFGLMLLGIGIGFSVGILPGLGGPTTLALMLPFIVKMNPVQAFAFLLGMASVTNTTGDITSILFGVPGEPTTAATIVDGHPLAKKGEAGRALGAALMSSLVGAIFGAFALALAIPIVRPLVLTFGSPEFFMLALLGITFVASLSGGVLLKGLIAGGIGLFLATVGLCPMSSIQRYTFGQTFLWDGIGLVPITIGFFAIPEIVDLAIQGSSIARGRVGKLGGVLEGVKDTFRHWWLVIRCSAIGTYTAVIPGMGGATTQWLAYAHAVQSSPDKERFGKGAIEGVLGPGAANNSTLGGSLITTIAFGVPASVMMAILLGAFLIHGVVPGPDMLIPEPKGHLALTFSFVWINVVSNIITVGVCFLILNQLVKITQIRGSLLIPFILLLIYLGAFAEKNTFEDLILLLLFGLLGWVLQRLKWPRPPLILGLVLGPLAENRLFLSTDNYGFAWLFRPGVLIILALTLAGAFYPILRARWQKRKKDKGQPSVLKAASPNGTRLLRFSWGMVFSLFIVVVFICALWQSMRFNVRAGLFPWAVGFPVLALAIVQFVMDFMGKEGRRIEDRPIEAGIELPSDVVNRRTAGIFVWIIGYFFAIWLLGFSIAAPLCTFIQLKIGAREKWFITLILSGAAWAFTYGVFDRLLRVPFPPGYLFQWLG
ncbi:MAG: tripartite tricarboxylate transporter permease [Thermodesulfobacteriota bacterium]|nr:tripartite tricarboxylate transporter permease [Thermodesulfobacteriota bacterium]